MRCFDRGKRLGSAFSVHSSGHWSDRDMMSALVTVPATRRYFAGHCRVPPQHQSSRIQWMCLLEYTGHCDYSVWNCFWADLCLFFPFSFVWRCQMLNATKAYAVTAWETVIGSKLPDTGICVSSIFQPVTFFPSRWNFSLNFKLISTKLWKQIKLCCAQIMSIPYFLGCLRL